MSDIKTMNRVWTYIPSMFRGTSTQEVNKCRGVTLSKPAWLPQECLLDYLRPDIPSKTHATFAPVVCTNFPDFKHVPIDVSLIFQFAPPITYIHHNFNVTCVFIHAVLNRKATVLTTLRIE